MIATNLTGAFLCIQQVLARHDARALGPDHQHHLGGRANRAMRARRTTSASKAGLIGLTKSLAQEMGSRNITVNAVAPGFIDTDMTAVLCQELKESILTRIPLKRLGKPEDVAAAVRFLASEEADYITGTCWTSTAGCICKAGNDPRYQPVTTHCPKPIRRCPSRPIGGDSVRCATVLLRQAQNLGLLFLPECFERHRGLHP